MNMAVLIVFLVLLVIATVWHFVDKRNKKRSKEAASEAALAAEVAEEAAQEKAKKEAASAAVTAVIAPKPVIAKRKYTKKKNVNDFD